MQRFWSFFVCLTLVLGLGLAQAPRPCRGDGHGQACAMTTCHCEADCTCQISHAAELRARAIAAAALCGDAGRAPVVAGCHHAARGQDFGLPQKHFMATLPENPAGLWLAHAREVLPNAPPASGKTRFEARERPPRLVLHA
jgi:hypothetical protein